MEITRNMIRFHFLSFKEANFLYEVEKYFNRVGFFNSLEKIYYPCETFEFMPILLMLLTHSAISMFSKNNTLNSYVKKSKSEEIDYHCFLYGMIGVIRQTHENVKEMYEGLLVQYIRSGMNIMGTEKKKSKIFSLSESHEHLFVASNLLIEMNKENNEFHKFEDINFVED